MLITKLKPNQVFVFGSNTKGINGAGAAAQAMKWGAKMGIAHGHYGQTYAICTKRLSTGFLGWDFIREELFDLFDYAEQNPKLEFLLTDVGCGLAGGKREDLEAWLDSIEVPTNVVQVWRV